MDSPEKASLVNSEDVERGPAVSPDGLEMYFSGHGDDKARSGGHGRSDLWVTRRETRQSPWAKPINLGETVNSSENDCRPCLSPDGLLLFFDSSREGGIGGFDIWFTRRISPDHPWSKPMNAGPIVNSPGNEYFPYYSAEDSTLFFNSDRPDGFGGHDIWRVQTEMPNDRSEPQ